MTGRSVVGVRSLALGGVVLAALCALGGSTARATLGGYYEVSANPERWVDINDPVQGFNTVVLYGLGTATPDSSQILPLPFATGFPYNGNNYGTLTVASNGFASFSDVGSGFCDTGACFPAATILAPWWGGTALCYDNASVSWTTIGQEPDLEVIVQWTRMSYDHSGNNDCSGTDIGKDLFDVQMRLHESGVIDFVYGDHFSASGTINCGDFFGSGIQWCQPNDFPPPACTGGFCGFGSGNACLFAAGLEDDSVNPSGAVALDCGASCAHNLFPLSGTVNQFTNGPDLQLGLVDVLGQFSQGLTTTVTVQVANVAPNAAASRSTGAESIDLSLSTSPFPTQFAIYLGRIPSVPPLAAGAPPETVSTSVTLPAVLPAGTLYVVAELREPSPTLDVDPTGKFGASNPIVATSPLPDLVAGPLNSAGSGSPGDQILLVPSVSNQGNAGAPAGITYAYYLAPTTAQAVSPTDLQIGLAQLLPAIAVGGHAPTVQDTVALPPWLPAGTYKVGMIIDPGNLAGELSKQNNGVLSTTLLQVSDNGLQIATTALPYGYVGGPYQALLTAKHGSAPYVWSLANVPDNPMPPGLALSASGQITGTPSAIFSGRVYFQVADSSVQQETATKPLVFDNVASQLPLTVVTQQLPTGGFNGQYLVQLAAIGGQWPYRWSLLSGAGSLPPGMALGADGTLTGVPTQSGNFSFQAQVVDASATPMTAVSARLNLQISAPGLVTLAVSELPVGVVGQPYVGILRAAGGSGKYEWTLINDTQLPDAPGATTKNWNNVEPPGFDKIALSGQVSGQPSEAGLFALSVQAQEVKSDGSHGASATDTVLLRVVPADGLQIKNSSLPDATVGLPYSAKLETNAVSSVGSIFFQPVDGSGQDTSAARASIPAGLTLNQDGTLSGTPRATGRYLFLVQAVDQAQGRSTIAALSLNVADKVATVSGGGCTTGGGATATSPWLLAMLGLAVLRPRRRRG
jgi:MYXO-CTERM domain-containing protein